MQISSEIPNDLSRVPGQLVTASPVDRYQKNSLSPFGQGVLCYWVVTGKLNFFGSQGRNLVP